MILPHNYMCWKFYRFSNLYFRWRSHRCEVRDLDPGLSISTVGGVIKSFAGLNNWYGISGTTTFTVSGNVTGDTTFTVVTEVVIVQRPVSLIQLL